VIHVGGGREHVVVLNVHHIAIDAWSNRLLFRDIGTAYNAILQGQPPGTGQTPTTIRSCPVRVRVRARGNQNMTSAKY
jgi:NRPS condensation-like uncharacterized protein